MKDKFFPQVFIIYTRYAIGFAFVFASLVKIQGLRFTAESGAENPINSAWHFFETMYQSGIYWRFIGIAQFIAGFLLLTQRYAKLGALMNLPIIANIFIITISYDFNGTPIITALMLLANFLLIIWDWDTFKIIVNGIPKQMEADRLENDNIWQEIGFVFLMLAITFKAFMNQQNIFFWFLAFPIVGIIGFVIGYKKRSVYNRMK